MKRVLVLVGLLLIIASYVLLRRPPEARPPTPEKTSATKIATSTKSSLPRRDISRPNPGVRVEFDDDPKGELSLEGQVIDQAGQPVEGALVSITSNPKRQTTTTREGWFSFQELVARDYQIQAHQGNAYAGPQLYALRSDSTPLTLQLREGAKLKVKVLDAVARRPIKDATVELRSILSLQAVTNEEGLADLDGISPGVYTLLASADGYGTTRQLYTNTGIAGTTQEQTLLLQSGAGVSGVVLRPDGTPAANAKVFVESTSTTFLPAQQEPNAITDEEGKWSIQALSSGTYRFRATASSFSSATSELITLDGESPREGVILQLKQGSRLSGRVVNQGGEGIAGATVRIVRKDTPSALQVARQHFCDEEGRFDIKGLPKDLLAVVASAEEGSSSIVEVDLSRKEEATEVMITLDQMGTISGVVVNAEGATIADVEVSAWPENFGLKNLSERQLRDAPIALSDPDGRFVLSGLTDGKYRLRASRPGAFKLFMLSKEDGTLASVGEQGAKVIFSDDGSIKGKVVYADGTSPNTFSVAVGLDSPTTFVESLGKFTVPMIRPGTQDVRVSGADFVEKVVKQVEIKASKETDLGDVQVEKGRSVSGVVTDASGQPVRGALVVAGRFILGDGANVLHDPLITARLGLKEAITDESGRYQLAGLVENEQTLVADAGLAGRSKMALLPAGKDGRTINFVVEATGSLQGKITKADKPVIAAVSVYHEGANNGDGTLAGFYQVKTGEDGAYRLDRLAPGTYKISAQKLDQSSGESAVEVRTVKILSGETATTDIALPSGVKLSVKVTGTEAPVKAAIVTLVNVPVKAKTFQQFEDALRPLEQSAVRNAFVFEAPGFQIDAAEYEDVPAGDYTICATRSVDPSELTGAAPPKPDPAQPVTCLAYQVTKAPDLQQTSVTIQ